MEQLSEGLSKEEHLVELRAANAEAREEIARGRRRNNEQRMAKIVAEMKQDQEKLQRLKDQSSVVGVLMRK